MKPVCVQDAANELFLLGTFLCNSIAISQARQRRRLSNLAIRAGFRAPAVAGASSGSPERQPLDLDLHRKKSRKSARKRKNAERLSAFEANSNWVLLAELLSAPRGGLNSNQVSSNAEPCTQEVTSSGCYRDRPLERFQQSRTGDSGPPKEPRDPLKLAHYYQSLLDSGQFENRAALARYLGVSRARVTQVLRRLG